jgi:copper chaperone
MATTYRVDGMTCEGCSRAVTNAIRAAAPDSEVEVDLALGLVTVAGTPGEALVRNAVETAGFGFCGVAPRR